MALPDTSCAALPGVGVRCLGVVFGAPWPCGPPPPEEALTAAADKLAADTPGAVARLPEGAPPHDGRVLPRDFVSRQLRDGAEGAVKSSPQGWIAEARLAQSGWPFSLQAVRRPGLLWHGHKDAAVPLQEAMAVAEQLPDARLQQVIPEAGHLGCLEQQDEV